MNSAKEIIDWFWKDIMKFVVYNRPNSIGLSTVTEESFNNRSRRPELRKIIDRIPDITGSYFFNRKLSPELGKDGEYLVEKMDSFLNPDGICQCRTEKIIRVSTDPVRSRAFMMIGMLIDHAMLMHFNNLHSSFQKSFKFPRVVPHGESDRGFVRASWLIYETHGSDEKMYWGVVSEVSEILLTDLYDWFKHNGWLDEMKKFQQILKDEVNKMFEIVDADKLIPILERTELRK